MLQAAFQQRALRFAAQQQQPPINAEHRPMYKLFKTSSDLYSSDEKQFHDE